MGFDLSNSWALGYDGLAWEDLVKFENQCRFALKSVQGARSKLDRQRSPQNHVPIEREREGKSIEESLQDTSREIRASGSLASWLESRPHTQGLHLQSPSVKRFIKNVKSGQHSLNPIVENGFKRNAIESMLWLVFESVSFPHALLILCSFTTNRLCQYSFGEITSIWEYVSQERDSLYCEALEAEADTLASYQAPSKKRKRITSSSEDTGAPATIASSTLQFGFSLNIIPKLSSSSLQLLTLITALGGVRVPRLMFERSLASHVCWGYSWYTASHSGFDFEFITQSNERLVMCFEELLSESWITMENDYDPPIVTISILDTAKKHVTRLMRGKGFNHWNLYALEFVCRVFPRDPAMEANFQRDGKLLAPFADHLRKQCESHHLPPSTKEALAEFLIAKEKLDQPSSPFTSSTSPVNSDVSKEIEAHDRANASYAVALGPSLWSRPLQLFDPGAQPNMSMCSGSDMKFHFNFSQLDEDSREFLGMASSIGDCFPSDIFDQAHNSLNWGSNGQAICPGSGVPQGHKKMLERLKENGFIIPLPNNGVGTTMMIHPEVPGMLCCFGQMAAKRWQRLATNAILHAYPKDAQLRPLEYTVAGASLIPMLGRALSHLLQCSPDDLESQVIELAIDACLSASNFGDKRWKTVAVAFAEHMANQLGCAVTKGRVRLRTASLARLYPRDIPSPQEIYIPRTNNRSNADFGKLKLLEARLQIEARSSTEEINKTLNQFSAFNPISNLEESIQLEINFLRVKLQRYDGDFGRAKNTLVDFMEALRYRASNMMTIQYYETVCEAGYPSNAIGHLEYEYGELLKKEQGQSGNGRRLRLALGGAYLMEFLSNRPFDNDLLKKAEKLFRSIHWMAEPSMVTKHNLYVTKASLGMVHLLRSEWEKSMKYWDEALYVSRDCFQKTGHAEMLIQYAQCEILYRLGRYSEAVIKGSAAQEIFQECGRQYYFLGQGTAWLDKLDELAREGGRPAIAARGSNAP